MAVKIEVEGRRVYFVGDTYAHKDAIKSLGAKWDAERRAWWVGSAKRADAEKLLTELCPVQAAAASVGLRPDTPAGIVADKMEDAGQDPASAEKVRQAGQRPAENPSEVRITGRARYKGRDYYVRWAGQTRKGDHKARLTTLDGSIDFWARLARPGYRPAADEAVLTTTYREERSLRSLQRFVEERRKEEEAAKAHRQEIQQAARGEPTRDIPRLRDARLIRAFFGDRAVTYDYTVTHEDFDDDDNQGPGHYYGATVPASLADRWDAGVNASRAAGHTDMRSRLALTIRYRTMMQDQEASLPAELEALLTERETQAAAEQAAKNEAARKAAEEKAALAALTEGLAQSTCGPTDHGTVAWEPGTALTVDGTQYSRGQTADGQTVVRSDWSGYDDYRTYYYAPPALARQWALTWAEANGVTAEQARAWLADYSGCHGADLYRAVVEAAEQPRE